jgi:hypothetical protein
MKAKADDQDTILKAAKEYVQQQLAIMKEFGRSPRLSAEAYQELVQQVAKATK